MPGSFSLTDRFSRQAELSKADDAARQGQQSSVHVGTSFVADAEPFALVQPGEGTLDDPAHLAKPRTMGDAASGDHRLDAAFPKQAAVLVEVVSPVGVEVGWVIERTFACSTASDAPTHPLGTAR